MRGKRLIHNEFSGRLFKTAVLTFTLLTIQATCLYFGSRTGRDQAPLDSIGNVVDHHNLRKLMAFYNASSKPKKPVSPSDPCATENSTDYQQDKNCSDLHQLNSSEAKCQFIKSTKDCNMSEGFFQYLQFPYCSLPKLVPVAFVVLAAWLIFLFIVLGTTADEYFCPSLTVISKTLGISQNVAGVTFLAYGNGAPDIFSALAAFTHSTSPDSTSPQSFQLGIQALFGAGVFVTTVVIGVISFMPAFTLTSRPFIRDIIFYLGAVTWAFITLYDQRIRLREAIGFIVLYVAYVLVVIVGHYVYQRWKRRLRIEIPALESPTASVDLSIQWSDQHEDGGKTGITSAAKGALSLPYDRCDQNEHRAHSISEGLFNTERAVVAPAIKKDLDPDHKVSTGRQDSPLGESQPLLGGEPRPSAWRQFLQGLEPIDREEWSQSKILWKCFLICKAPAVFCLNLTLPVVDYDKENDNWNKWLNVLHCATVPVFCVMATKAGNMMIGGKFPAWALALCVGLILALIIAMTTRNDKQPMGHFLFAYLAFVASVIWIYSTANEIVNLLRTFGAVSGLSDAVLGLTFLAWGNSIGDFVSNTAMARQGFPRMAVSACFGGPLLNMLLGIGLSCTVATIHSSRGHAICLPNKDHQYVISAGFLAASLSSSAIVIPLLGFRVPRMYGVFLIVLYIAYLTVSIVAEIKKF